MQTRYVKDVVHDVIEQLKDLVYSRIDICKLPEEARLSGMLVQLESDIFTKFLRELLRDNANCQREATLENLSPFYDFLKQRWRIIKKTDLTYSFTTHTTLNQTCIKLARILSAENHLAFYDVLMPNDAVSHDGQIAELQLHEFILGDDGLPLSVEHCFHYLERQLASSSEAQISDAEDDSSGMGVLPRRLTLSEEYIITNHSRLAHDYYAALRLNEEVSARKTRLIDALKCTEYQVTATYGPEGEVRLLQNILMMLHSPFGLSQFLCAYLPSAQWNLFLDALPNEALFRIVLNLDMPLLQSRCGNAEVFKKIQSEKCDEKLQDIVKKSVNFKDENQLRAFMLCLLAVYKRSREMGPDFKSSAGAWIGYYTSWVHSKEDKIKSCDIYRDFLLSEPPQPLDQLEDYLRVRGLHEKYYSPLMQFSRLANNMLPNLVAFAAAASRADHLCARQLTP